MLTITISIIKSKLHNIKIQSISDNQSINTNNNTIPPQYRHNEQQFKIDDLEEKEHIKNNENSLGFQKLINKFKNKIL